MEYTIWLALCAGIPLLFLWLVFRDILKRYSSSIITLLLLSLLVHIPWDIYAVQQGIWTFPYKTNLGIMVFNLPIEELLYTAAAPLIAIATVLIVYRSKKT